MRYTNVEISKLLPIQGTVVMDSLIWWLKHPALDKRNIPVVKYGEQYIVCDGHHGTMVRLMRGINDRPVKIIETEEDIRGNMEGALGYAEDIPGLIKVYEKGWKPLCKSCRVNNFQDYLQKYAQEISEINSRLKAK